MEHLQAGPVDVQQLHVAVQDDAVQGGLHQAAELLFGIRQFPGQLLPPGHVQDDLHRPLDAALLIINGGGGMIEIALPAPEVGKILVGLIGPGQVGRGFQVLVPEKLFQGLDVLLHHQGGHGRPLMGVERQPVAVGPHHFMPGKPGQFLAGPVPVDDAVVPVDDEGGHRQAFQDAFGGLLLPQEFPFLALAFVDILQDAFVAGDAPLLIPAHDAGEQGMDLAAGLGFQGQFQVPDIVLHFHLELKAFPIPGLLKDFPEMGQAQGLGLGGKFQEFHSRRVEVQEAALQVGDEDHVLGPFKDAAVALFRAAQLVIQPGVFNGQADLVAQDAEEIFLPPGSPEGPGIFRRQIEKPGDIVPVFQGDADHRPELGVLPDQLGKRGGQQARVVADILNDQRLDGLGAVGPHDAFRGPAGDLAQVLLGKAPGRGIGQALAPRVPQQQHAGVDPEKLEDGGQDLVDDLLEVQGMRGDGGDLIEQVQFPAMFLLPRLWLPHLLNGAADRLGPSGPAFPG